VKGKAWVAEGGVYYVAFDGEGQAIEVQFRPNKSVWERIRDWLGL
jgi:hypothetical protein